MESQSFPEDVYFTFTGYIDSEVVKKFFACFSAATQRKAKRVHLLVHSMGGNVHDGIAIYHFLKALPLEVITYNGGQVASIAVLIFLSGSVRRASELASFVIHKSTATFPAPATADDMEIGIKAARDNDRTIESVLHAYLKMPEEKWAIHATRNLTITAQEAVEFALVHDIENYHIPEDQSVFNI